MPDSISRRDALRLAAAAAAGLAFPLTTACAPPDAGSGSAGGGTGDDIARDEPSGLWRDPTREELARLRRWTAGVRSAGLHRPDAPFGRAAARVGEEAAGTPYEGFTLEAYIRAGGDPARAEPLTLDLERFDCVSLVESCIAIARLAARTADPAWTDFGREMERLRYRGGVREGYLSRLHYFSEWIRDNEARGGVVDLGEELGGVRDDRPLRFMTSNRDAYPALADDAVLAGVAAMERRLDAVPRRVIPTDRIPEVADRIRTGDIVAFATAIEGLDVTHAAFAYRDAAGALRVLHAPLSGGEVEVTAASLHEYVRAIRRSTGILVARPIRG